MEEMDSDCWSEKHIPQCCSSLASTNYWFTKFTATKYRGVSLYNIYIENA